MIKHLLKFPDADEYLLIKNIIRFRRAAPTKQYPGHRVFVDFHVGGAANLRWFIFKTKKEAIIFCSKLAKQIEELHNHVS